MSMLKNEDARFFWFTIGFSFIVFGTGFVDFHLFLLIRGRRTDWCVDGQGRTKRLMTEPEKGFYLLRVFKDRNNQNKRAEQWAAITQDIETARAILAKAKQETRNQNSFRSSRVGSFRSKNEFMHGKRRLSHVNSSDRKPRSSGTLNHIDQSSADTRASSLPQVVYLNLEWL